MKIVKTMLVVACLAFPATAARASVITFNLTGVPGISGYVAYDAAYLGGSGFAFVPNLAIVGLAIDVFGEVFDLGDVVASGATFFDLTTSTPRIDNGFGLLVNNGVHAIAYLPDGWDGTPLDGDAALLFVNSTTFFPTQSYAVHWTVAAAPEPGTAALVGIALLGLAAARRRA